ncbi:TPR-like protein [Aspergillus granulosus]|uniref:TPR-like protein n=1 Tax=Aspergillus granulosus TaxID=176169 RepID=A0ABR4GRQ7_9EURO
MTFTHSSYSVAWICALPLELATAKAVLDEVHPTLPQPKTDHNVYTLGSAGGHNVVVACLPAGIYGTTSATAVVSHLRSTYQNIRFGLMVGVGGGVPGENHDIRLGDIVVSKPTPRSSGVIQYDYGKALQDKRLHCTGSLNKPPPILLKVIAQMESDHILGKGLLGNLLKAEVQKQFPRPSKDHLFQSTYNHIGDGPNCSACDQSQLVNRPTRVAEEPYIHYGLIASGNQVIKDPKLRDLIAKDEGILCFEMEAAGLMDEIPSLVIRGVCDYCDSHKDKEWQAYAAFVAAAYAKAVLMQIPQEQSAELKETVPEKRHWMVPFHRNLGFVGREEEITKVEALIKIGQCKIAICGLGGVGKTQIALELAYRIRERDSRCSIFWIPCTSYASVEQAYMSIAQLVGMQDLKPGEATDRVKAYLSQDSAGKWLLIFDNADDIDMWAGGSSATTGVTKFVPQGEQGCILFTTCNRKVAVKLASPFVIDISEPDAETGMEILEKAVIRKDLLANRDATITLLQQLMFLPLAITQAAAYINTNDLKVTDYIALLQEQEPDVLELLSEDFGDDGQYQEIQNPVATTWLISFQQIQQLNPLAADYLSFMACVNPREIPQSLLPPANSKKKRLEAIGLLKGFAFVSEQIKDHALSLHRLVHLSARNWLRQHRQFNHQIIKTADQLDQIFPDNDHSNQKVWRDYLPHALSLVHEREFEEVLGNYIKLVRNIGRCLRTDGRYKEAAAIFEKLLSAQSLGRNDPDISALISLGDLALTYSNQGRWKEAEELEVQVLEIRKRVLGPEHPDTLTSMSNLACTYSDQGRWKVAEELKVQVLEIRKRVLGPKHLDTLTSMSNLACTYSNQGRWKEAEELEVQVLEIRKRVLGPEHPETLLSMSNLASAYLNQGQWKEAEVLKVQVLEIRKRVLGPKHLDTLISMSNLAFAYLNQGRLKEAEELEVQVLETRNQVLGPKHPDTLACIANLARLFADQGLWKEAEELGVQVLEIRKQVLGPEHPDTLTSMGNLARSFADQGQWKVAEELKVQVLETRKRVQGPEHPDTLLSMSNLACTYSDQGRWKEAEELEVQVLETSKRVLGPEHPDTLISMVNLARSHADQGRWKEAEELYVQVLEICKRVLGPEDPSTLLCISRLALTYSNQGRWKEAEELEVQVLEIRKRVLGPEHPDTLTSMANLARLFADHGQWKEAEELEVQVLEICKRVLGPEDPSTLLCMSKLALTYSNQGRWKEAEELEVQVLEIRKRVLGPEHPDTLLSMSNLACTYSDQGRWKEAEELEVQVLEIRKRVLDPEHPGTLPSMANLTLRNRVLRPSHPDSTSSSHRLSDWEEPSNLLTDKHRCQAGSIQLPEEIQQECAPALVITEPPEEDEKHIALHQSHGRPKTPITRFLESHPLLIASRSSYPALGDHDVQEVD